MDLEKHTSWGRKLTIAILAIILLGVLFFLIHTIILIQAQPASSSESGMQAFIDSLKAPATPAPLSAEQKSQVFQSVKASTSAQTLSPAEEEQVLESIKAQQ